MNIINRISLKRLVLSDVVLVNQRMLRVQGPELVYMGTFGSIGELTDDELIESMQVPKFKGYPLVRPLIDVGLGHF